MTLQLHPHGSCCGAGVIDGFFCADVMSRVGYPTHEAMIRELRGLLEGAARNKGSITVILNEKQGPIWHEDLLRFGFKLLNGDIANPNHSHRTDSRLFLYQRVSRHFYGDREAAGLGEMPEITPIPQDPPPPSLSPALPIIANNRGPVDWGILL